MVLNVWLLPPHGAGATARKVDEVGLLVDCKTHDVAISRQELKRQEHSSRTVGSSWIFTAVDHSVLEDDFPEVGRDRERSYVTRNSKLAHQPLKTPRLIHLSSPRSERGAGGVRCPGTPNHHTSSHPS